MTGNESLCLINAEHKHKQSFCSDLALIFMHARTACHAANIRAGMLAYLVKQAYSICELSIAQVGLQEPEEGQQQALEVGPPLVAGSQQQLGHQVAVTH